MAGDDEATPSYGKADLEKALIAERGAEATNERLVADAESKGDDEALRVGRHQERGDAARVAR